jgi:hypothetical protein
MCKYGLRESFPQHDTGQAVSDSSKGGTEAVFSPNDRSETAGIRAFGTLLAM